MRPDQSIFIRKMHISDVSEILKIERLSFSPPWSEKSFLNEIYNKSSITNVAEFKGIIVGYVCARYFLDECHLLNLAIHPDYRRLGIASMLLDDLLEKLKNYGCLYCYLEVRISNYPSRRLYEKFGFKTVGIRKKYYLCPIEDAIIMMKEL